MNGNKVFQLILIVVAGVIVADLVAHADGTSALINGVGTLFAIGTQPTNTNAIKTVTPLANTGGTSKKV